MVYDYDISKFIDGRECERIAWFPKQDFKLVGKNLYGRKVHWLWNEKQRSCLPSLGGIALDAFNMDEY